jgi:outer membrane protein OmpA-like peptidoglycan-associated protein
VKNIPVPVPNGTAPLSSDAQKLGGGIVAGGRFTQNLHRYISLEEGFTWGRSETTLQPLGGGATGRFDNNTYQLAINPVVHFTPRGSKFRPFVTAGAATQWFSPTGTADLNSPNAYPRKTSLDAAFIYGGGVKAFMSPRIGVRLDARGSWGPMPHFGLPSAPTTAGAFYSPTGQTLGGFEISAGLIFGFRVRNDTPPPPPPPPPAPAPAPPAFAIDAINGARDICPGDALTLSAAVSNAPADATYEWTLNGQPAGNAPTLSIPSSARGTQQALVKVSAGGVTKEFGPVSFRVKEYANPSVTVTASPTTIPHGEQATLTSNAKASECGGTARVSYAASEGTISGNTFDSTGVAFDPNATREQVKTVTITATATDEKGGTGTATTQVTVTEKPHARRLDDVVFARNSARVNNCGKRLLLEELTALLRDKPDSQVILVGHRDEQEKGAAARTLDRRRVLNAAAVLSAGKGICPQLDLSRIKVNWAGTDQASQPRPSFCGASTNVRERRGQGVVESDSRAQYRRVEIWFVPSGADAPEVAAAAKEAPASEIKKLGCPR